MNYEEFLAWCAGQRDNQAGFKGYKFFMNYGE